jgi:hypothetical protein
MSSSEEHIKVGTNSDPDSGLREMLRKKVEREVQDEKAHSPNTTEMPNI